MDNSDSEIEISKSKKNANNLNKRSEENINSKATPEFYSPIVESSLRNFESKEPVINSNDGRSQSLDLPQTSVKVVKLSTKKRNSKKKNKVSHDSSEKPDDVHIESEIQKEQNTGNVVDVDDKKLLLEQDKHEKTLKKTNKKPSLSSRANQNSNDDDNDDSIV